MDCSTTLPAIMRRIAGAILVLGISGACERTVEYQDFANSDRGSADLKMDFAVCRMIAGAPQVQSSGCRGCALLDVGTAVMEQQNAIDACMESRGWDQR